MFPSTSRLLAYRLITRRRWGVPLLFALAGLLSLTGFGLARRTAPVALAQIGPQWPDLHSRWYCNTASVCHVYGGDDFITQSGTLGENLQFTEELGSTSQGHFTSTTSIKADDWGLTVTLGGLVGDCYTELNWSNGVQWKRILPTNGCGNATGGPQVWTVNDAGMQNPPSYALGDNLQFCFSTPSLGASVLTDVTPDGSSTIVSQYGGDATSQCVAGLVLFDGGQECLELAFTPVEGGVSGATQLLQVCWQDIP